MNIQHKEGERHSMFFIEEDGNTVAEIVYSYRGPHTMVIEHTGVDESLQGKHIGNELVHKTVEYARSKGLKVVPLCVFAKALFDKKPEWADVIATNA